MDEYRRLRERARRFLPAQPDDERHWRRALKAAEQEGDELAMISVAMLLKIPWQEQVQMLKKLKTG